MSRAGEQVETAVTRLNEIIVTRPRVVVALFLVATAVFAGGMTAVETQTDATSGFSEDLPEQEALDRIETEFDDPFAADPVSTQLIHDGTNVLDREELLTMLRLLERLDEREDLRVETATGPATIVAQTLDPAAQTPTAQRRAVEDATDTEIRQTVRRLSENDRFAAIRMAGTASYPCTVSSR